MAPSCMAELADTDLNDYLDQIQQRSKRSRRVGLVLIAVVLAAAGVVTYELATRKTPPRVWHRPLPAPTAKAFESGGVPLHEAAIDAALAQPLTDLVIQAANARDNGSTEYPDCRLRGMLSSRDLAHCSAIS